MIFIFQCSSLYCFAHNFKAVVLGGGEGKEGMDFALQGTFGNIWRHVGCDTWEVPLDLARRSQGCCSNILPFLGTSLTTKNCLPQKSGVLRL